jgi:hypothetical protein
LTTELRKPRSSLTREALLIYRRILTDPQPAERWGMIGRKVARADPSWRLFADDWLTTDASLVTHQAMLTRSFLPLTRTIAEPALCSYLVHYPGPAEDFNEWLSYYITHHPQIMLDYPNVRQINVFTRVDWCDSMPWTRVNYMQRNMLSFPSSQLLAEALSSPVRARMREDNGRFPAFSGCACHYPMLTTVIAPDNGKYVETQPSLAS